MSTAIVTPPAQTDAPAPGSLAAMAAADDVRGFMDAREKQLRGEQAAAPAEVPATEGEPPAPPEGDQPPAGEPAAETPPAEVEAADAEAAKVSEAARTLNEAKKRKSRPDELREEIGDLTWQKHRLKEQIAEAAAELARMRQPQTPPAAQPEAKPFDPGPEPKVGDFSDYEDYVKAAAKHAATIAGHAAEEAARKAVDEARKADREAAVAAQQQAEQAAAWNAHKAREAEFVKAKPDFHEKIAAATSDPDRALPNWMGTYLIQNELGPQLGYELATMPLDTLRGIVGLPFDRALAALGGLEYQIKSRQQPSHPSGPTPVRKQNPAARPVSPVGSSAPVTAVPSQELVTTDPSAWMRQRDLAELKRKGRIR